MALTWKRRKILIYAAVAALLLTLIPMSVYAQGESTVNATVTPGFAAVTTNTSSVAYGIVNLGSVDAIPTPGSFTATNDGTVAADFLIRGADTTDWILSGSAGPNAYVHKASSDAFGGQTLVLTSIAVTLETGIAPTGGTSTVSLKMDMPTTTTSSDEQIAAVTVVAVVP